MDLVILDRDGVINEDSDKFIKCPEEWRPIPGSLEAIARLNQAGYRVAVASNQSGIARGLLDVRMLSRIHQKMHRRLSEVGGQVDAIFFCPHGPNDNCECRKPKPGLLYEVKQRMARSLTDVPCVGDALRDIQAARAAGATPILVKTGKGARQNLTKPDFENVPIYADLASFVEDFLQGQE